MKRLLLLLLFAASPSFADIAFVASSTNTANAADVTVNKPTGTVDGHVMLGCFTNNSASTTTVTLTGWTPIAVTIDNTGGSGQTHGIWYKVASSEGASYTFDSDSPTNSTAAAIVTLSGVDNSNPLDVAYVAGSHYLRQLNDATPTPQPITTTTDGAWVATCTAIIQSTVMTDFTPSSSYDERAQIVSNNRSLQIQTIAKATAGTETPGNLTLVTGAGTEDASMQTVALRPAASAPTFDTNPTLDACTATGCTFDYEAGASGNTLYAMLTDTAAAAPTCDAIEATTGTHGHNSEATTGNADTITITSTDTPVFPLYDAHFCIEGAGGDSSVVTVSDNTMTAPTGRQFAAITSIGSDSACEDFNTATAPDIANGDYLLADLATDPDAFDLSISAACQYSYTGDESKQSILDTAVYDASVGDWHAEDLDVWVNNPVPVCRETPAVYVFTEDEAADPIDLNNECEDDDTLTFTVSSGTPPTGISISGGSSLGGTPTTEDETGAALTILATDIPGDTDSFTATAYVVNTVTLADYTAGTRLEAEAQHLSDFPWQGDDLALSVIIVCSDSEAANEVTTQDPAGTTEVTAFQSVSINVSDGTTCPTPGEGKRRVKGATMNGVSIGS